MKGLLNKMNTWWEATFIENLIIFKTTFLKVMKILHKWRMILVFKQFKLSLGDKWNKQKIDYKQFLIMNHLIMRMSLGVLTNSNLQSVYRKKKISKLKAYVVHIYQNYFINFWKKIKKQKNMEIGVFIF